MMDQSMMQQRCFCRAICGLAVGGSGWLLATQLCNTCYIHLLFGRQAGPSATDAGAHGAHGFHGAHGTDGAHAWHATTLGTTGVRKWRGVESLEEFICPLFGCLLWEVWAWCHVRTEGHDGGAPKVKKASPCLLAVHQESRTTKARGFNQSW